MIPIEERSDGYLWFADFHVLFCLYRLCMYMVWETSNTIPGVVTCYCEGMATPQMGLWGLVVNHTGFKKRIFNLV